MSDQIGPFRIAATDEQLEDLKRRLPATRWPERECGDDWTQGPPLGYAQEVASYWLQKYDWRAREALLNRVPQFKSEIDGLGITGAKPAAGGKRHRRLRHRVQQPATRDLHRHRQPHPRADGR
jgi:hypothetical protein